MIARKATREDDIFGIQRIIDFYCPPCSWVQYNIKPFLITLPIEEKKPMSETITVTIPKPGTKWTSIQFAGINVVKGVGFGNQYGEHKDRLCVYWKENGWDLLETVLSSYKPYVEPRKEPGQKYLGDMQRADVTSVEPGRVNYNVTTYGHSATVADFDRAFPDRVL